MKPKLEMPRWISDLYADLRDRRLLLPAAALIVGLVAVPVLLAQDSPPAPPPPPPPATAEATAAQPAVVVEHVGIRNYRERLEALKSKNPFKQQFARPTPESISIADTPSGSSAGAPSASSSSVSSTSIAPTGPTSGSAVGEPAPAPAPSGTGAEPVVRRTSKLITRVADVTLGPLGKTKEYENVKRTELLPSREEPIVAYFGASPNGKRAAFLISSGVEWSDGDGTCSPSPDNCSFVTMNEGDQRYLHFQPKDSDEEVIYRFKLLKITEKVVTGSRAAG
ncbi:MAG TPA: hypothetical protein VHJ54_06745 [Solirubrobacterales bacterium]|jgi:hypothetical protein|nr:hypothetical protein [Solirubrobacterales bacterium]